MNFPPHHAIESVVDEALPLDGSLALEPHRNDDSPEMAAAVAGARVPDMQMTLIDHFDVNSGETLAQLGFNTRTPIGRFRHVTTLAGNRRDQEAVTGIVRTCGCSSSGFGMTRSRTPFL